MSSPQEIPLLPVRVLHSEPALGKVRALATTRAGSLWAGTDSGVIVEFAYEGLEVRRFHAHKGGVTCLDAHGDLLLSGGKDGHVRLWNSSSLSLVLQTEAPGRTVLGVEILPWEVVNCVAWTTSGRVARWDNSGKRLDAYPTPPDSLRYPGVLGATRGVLDVRAFEDRLETFDQVTKEQTSMRLEELARIRAQAGTDATMAVLGRGRMREEILTLLELPSLRRLGTWRLPYGGACLAYWRHERTLYAGGNGRVFAIDLPSTGATSA